MPMYDPPHPGQVIKRQCLIPLNLTVTDAAKGLGVSRNTLSMLLNGRLGISTEMAIRLSQGFGGSPESWLRQQLQHDLWHKERQGKIKVKKFERPSASDYATPKKVVTKKVVPLKPQRQKRQIKELLAAATVVGP